MTVSFNPAQPAFGMALGRQSREVTEKYDTKPGLNKAIAVENAAATIKTILNYWYVEGNQARQGALVILDALLRHLSPDEKGHQTEVQTRGSVYRSATTINVPQDYQELINALGPAEKKAVAEMLLATLENTLENTPASILQHSTERLAALPYEITPEMDELLATAIKRTKPGKNPSPQEQWKYRMAVGINAPAPEGDDRLQQARAFVQAAWGDITEGGRN